MTTRARGLVAAGSLAWLMLLVAAPAALAPAQPNVLDTLGWVCQRAGQSAEAVTHLEKAVRIAPHSGAARFHLGTARLALGQ